ncbi:anaerobic sulfatase maturase [Clostridium grantii]|uniref:Radical SAM core domain-containing protein n=1 Tax=Clostridium grantii DSM 8605 TaxID=1121316 RepID=A0A1M5UD00_9CLOT|nr:anaerobic sulfatase maturase [Clostridium grantii]SHH60829.1 uncharacterized protein SAMN02745207_01716 [Clostridium grantii DSM 8605]
MNKPMSFLVKPASSLCNLRCKYCFYHSLSENREKSSYGIMTYDTLENLIIKAMNHEPSSILFAFQGGEPTLAGLDFYLHLIELVKKHNLNNIPISYALQTNGMLIDENWAKFLNENNFLVGVSLDGYKEIHDLNRVDSLNKGSFNKIMKSIDLLTKYEVDYNILVVVNAITARHADKIYKFFKKNNFKYLQFIPCLDPLGEIQGQHNFSLTPQAYGKFLTSLFDNWYKDVINNDFVSIRYFDNIVGMLLGQPPESCDMKGICSCQMVVESDGSVYPCDFYVIDEWKLGNLNENTIVDIQSNPLGNKFVNISTHVDDKCKQCKWLRLCRGGCRRNKEPFKENTPGLNYFCESYEMFYEHSIDKLMELARKLSR